MKKILIILNVLIIILISYKEVNDIKIPKQSIRIRVVSNSNNIKDQLKKIKVKEATEKILYNKLENVRNIEDAREIIKKNIPEINNKVKETLNNNNFNINYGYNYFPTKDLNGINYKEGKYESLVINIGESKGNNWWCVLFPPLCLIEVKNKNKNNIEYKSKVLEILNEYK